MILVADTASAGPAVFRASSFTKPMSTGAVSNHTVAHNLGTTPKAIILWTSNQTANTTNGVGSALVGIGFSDGTTHGSVSFASSNGTNPPTSRRKLSSTAIQLINSTGATDILEGTVALGPTNLTFNWTAQSTSAQTVIHYAVFGGSLLETKVVHWTLGTDNGANTTVTTTFKPNVCMHLWGGFGTTALGTDEDAGSLGFGVMDHAGRQWFSHARFFLSGGAARAHRLLRVDSMFGIIPESVTSSSPAVGDVVSRKAAFVSMNATGFTVDPSGTVTDNVRIVSLCMQNVHAHAGTFQRTNDGVDPAALTEQIRATSFTPAMALLSSVFTGSTTLISSHSRFGFGSGDGTRGHAVGFVSETHTVDSESYSHDRADAAIIRGSNVSGLVDGRGTVSSFASPSPTGGFNLTRDDNPMTPTAEYYAYLALASASSLAVQLDRFEARNDGRRLLFRWRTGLETNSLGFHLHQERAGVRRQLTRELIAGSALLVGGGVSVGAGGWYQWSTDTDAESSGAHYWLEELDLSGKSTLHGPFAARQGAGGPPELQLRRSPLLSDLGQLPSLREGGPGPGGAFSVLPARPLKAADHRRPAPWVVPAGPALKILVRREGLYRVGQAELLAAGLPAAVDPRQLRLFTDGREVRLRVDGEQDGRLDPGDALEFHGVGLDTTFSDARTYWLATAGPGPARRMTMAAAGAALALATGFPFTLEQKERSVYFAALLNGEGENFFGPLLSPTTVTRSFTVHHLDPAAGPAELRLSLQGVTDTAHRLRVQLNGQPLTSAIEWQSRELHRATLVLPVGPGGLVEGDNTLSLSTDGPTDTALLDSVRLTYPHLLVADDDAQRVTLPPGPDDRKGRADRGRAITRLRRHLSIGAITRALVHGEVTGKVNLRMAISAGPGAVAPARASAVGHPCFGNGVIVGAGAAAAGSPAEGQRADQQAQHPGGRHRRGPAPLRISSRLSRFI